MCRKGLCSENNDWSKTAHSKNQTFKKKKKEKRHALKGHSVSPASPSIGLRIQAWSLSQKTHWKNLIAWQTESLSTGWRHSFRLTPPTPTHRLMLAVVDLLIDAATETHWKSPGTGPMTWTYALFFMHVVVPDCTPPPPLIATFNITEIILRCVLKMTFKNL